MKEFQKKIKTVVKRHTPDKEQIRRTVKGEVSAAVTAQKVERSFSVGSLAAVAVMFILVTGIVIGSVLVEQTRKPAVSGVGNSDTETTNTTLPDLDEETDRVGENAVPLSYRIDTETPLMENPTSWETVRDGIRKGTVVNATERQNILDSELKNETTQVFYDQTGYEIFVETYKLYGIYLYDGKGVYTVTSDYILGCPVVLKHGETYGMLMASAWGSGIIRSHVFYYDFVTKSTVTLFIHSSFLPDDEVINQWLQENERVNADYELPDDIPYILPEYYRMLSVEPVYHENGDLSVRVFAMVQDGYEVGPYYRDVLLASYKCVWIGTLTYTAENKTWDYEPKETPEPVTTEAGEDTAAHDLPETFPALDVTLIENKPIETITIHYQPGSSVYRYYSSAEKKARLAEFLNELAILNAAEEPPVMYGSTLVITVTYSDGTSVILSQFDEYLYVDGGALYKLYDYNDRAALENFFYYNESDLQN